MGWVARAKHPGMRITTARLSRSDDIDQRQVRYMISMGIRTLCFIAAVAVGPGWLRWVLVAGAVFLPYVAVVLANNTDQRDDPFAMPEHLRELPAQASTTELGSSRDR